MTCSFMVPLARSGEARRTLETCGIDYRAALGSKAHRPTVVITVRNRDGDLASRLLGTRKR